MFAPLFARAASLLQRLVGKTPTPTTGGQEERPLLVLPLQRSPLWRRTLSPGSMLTVVLIGSTVLDAVSRFVRGEGVGTDTMLWLTMILAWLCVCVLGLLRRAFVRRFPMPDLVLTEHAVRLPAHGEAIAPLEMRFADLIAVGEAARVQVGLLLRRGPSARVLRRLVLESESRVVSLEEQWFTQPGHFDQCLLALREQLQRAEGVHGRLAATELARRPALASLSHHPLASQMTVGLMVVLFLNTWLKGAIDTPFGLLRWGAMAPSLVHRPSEAYRLISANFLHGHWLHMLMNGWALTYLGALLERLIGPARLIVLLFGTALVAMGASALHAGALLSVGASGAIFGLLGAFAMLSRRLRLALPLGLRQPPRWWATLVLINVVLPMLWPVIDWTAHVAGFVAGAALMLALLAGRRTLPPPARRPLLAAAGLAVVLTAGALCEAVTKAASANATQETALAEALLDDPATSASALGNLAWLWAVDPEADEEHLEAGSNCARAAILRAPLEPDLRVTMASLLHRRGERSAATEQWLAALEIHVFDSDGKDTDASALLATQLAREALGAPAAIRPKLGSIVRHGNAWHVGLEPEQSGPRVVYAAVQGAGGQLVAIVRLMPPKEAEASWELPDELCQALHDTGAETAELIASVRAGYVPSPSEQQQPTALRTEGTASPQPAPDRPPWSLWRPPRFFRSADAT